MSFLSNFSKKRKSTGTKKRKTSTKKKGAKRKKRGTKKGAKKRTKKDEKSEEKSGRKFGGNSDNSGIIPDFHLFGSANDLTFFGDDEELFANEPPR